ncbi:MAG: TraB/GumN family protein [Bacteroidota bacterium]
MKKKKRTVLWALEPGAELVAAGLVPATSYLFGTMHVRDQRAFGYLEQVYERIEACSAFATEFNLEEMNPEAALNMMRLPAGQHLEELFSPKRYQKLRRIFAKTTGIQLDLFPFAKPLLISNLISEAVLSKDMPHSLDESLWRHARSQGKVLLGLETYAQQAAVVQRIPLDYQVKALRDIGKNFRSFRRQLLRMTELYARADLQQLCRQARKNAGGLREILLYQRNHHMAARIEAINHEHSLCCAIGAGHLAGKRGVLRQLKKRGYQLRPIPAEKRVEG